MNIKLKYMLLLGLFFNLGFSFPDCEYGDPNWEFDYETVPFDHEFSATISAAQIFIDGNEMITGKLAGFVNNEIRALDSDGSSYFPPGDTNVFELMLWSNELSGDLFTFRYYSEDNDIIIDLNETYEFISNDIVGDAFNPMILTGVSPDCEDESTNHFGDVANNTGVSELIIFSDSISNLEMGDEIGIFDTNGLISDDCSHTEGEILVGYGQWAGEQLEVSAVSHIDFCDFGGFELPGFIEGNPIIVRVWDISEQVEYDAILTFSQGSSDFEETSFTVISEIDFTEMHGCTDANACNYDENANSDDGSCEYAEENYDCDGNCLVDIDCFGECGGDAVIDECGDCEGDGPDHQCWDGSIVCDPFECPDSEFPAPDLFSFNQSLGQAFYYINDIYINGLGIDSDDWLAAFNDGVCVGARKWDTDMCTNNVCDIGVMGDDGSDATNGYMLAGEFPTFKIYDASENIYYDAIPSENFGWENGGLFTIDYINETDYYCDDNPSCSGCMDTDACNYDSDALIDDNCYYMELNLLSPINNSIIIINSLDDLEGEIDFSWSSIHESCSDDIFYQLNVFDQNFNLIVSEQLTVNGLAVPFDNLNVTLEEINSYSWNVSMNEISSESFYFAVDASLLGIDNNYINHFNLSQNYPNPFNPITSIGFEIPYYAFVSINIYDGNGQFLEKLVENYYSSGSYNVYWDASNYSSGIYIYEMQADKHSFKRRMVLIK